MPAYLKFERRPGDNPWLDFARMIAILLVLARHGQRGIDPGLELTSQPLGFLFLNGWAGVDLFFVLSGYLIFKHLIKACARDSSFSTGSYLLSRALRIFPAYFFMLAIIVAGVFPLYKFSDHLLEFRVFYHLLFMNDYLGSNINVVFWSIAVEEKFYLAAPLVVWACLSRRKLSHRITILVAIALMSVFWRALAFAKLPGPVSYDTFVTHLRMPFHLCFEPLAAGAIVAVAENAGRTGADKKTGLRLMLACLAVLMVWLANTELTASISWRNVLIFPPALAAVFGAFVYAAVKMKEMRMPCELPVRVIARLAYTLYLTHWPLIPLCHAIAIQTYARLATFWSLYVSLSAIAALLLHYAVEKPFLIWKAKLDAARMNAQASCAPQQAAA